MLSAFKKCSLVVLLFTLLGSCKSGSSDLAEKPVVVTKTENLPSWNETASKKAIIDFVGLTTSKDSPGFIPEPDRIAVFDNDGTLWSEQPAYFQLLYALDRVNIVAPQHPEWKNKEPFASLLKGDMKAFMASGEKGLAAVMMASHAGMTTDELDKAVKDWLTSARHPKTGRPFNEMTYKPMVELLDYLRANGYKTFIVSGGGIDFMRVWAEKAYGIPPYQVVGSSIKTKYEIRNGQPVLVKIPELNFNDDKEGKPVGIHQHIGKRPVFAAGNSDGDFQMLQWTTTATGYPRFGMIVHHTDSTREYAYDRDSPIGRLNKGLDSAAKYNWKIIDMQKDWKKIYSFE